MNRVDSLRQTFLHLEKSSIQPYEVIVVDQTQELDLASRIKELCENSLLNTFYKWNSRPSLTEARNTGLALAKGDIVVFMDDDVDVKINTIANVINLFHDDQLAMAGGINELDPFRRVSILSAVFGMASYRKRYQGYVLRSVYGRFPIDCKQDTPSEWAMGFFFVVRKELVEKWHLKFDEHLQYYAYAEDLDFTYSYFLHAQAEGFKCIFSKSLGVLHNVSMEYRIPSRKGTFMMILHRRYIGHKLMPGFFTELCCLWSDLGTTFYRLLHREPIKDIIEALVFYYKNRRDIVSGNFNYSHYM